MFKSLRKKIGIIGYGNMGSAIAQRIKHKYHVFVFDKDESKIQNLAGIIAVNSIEDLISRVDVVILAVKPQDFNGVLNEVKNCIGDKLIVSIAAGITTEKIEDSLGRVRVIRVMPNIEAIPLGKSFSYLCKGRFSVWGDLKLAVKLFELIGHILISPECSMHAKTAVGGSSPGFWGYRFNSIPHEKWEQYAKDKFIPEFISAAISVGTDEQEAKLTADWITSASIATVEALHITPIQLTERVASKGGTTEAGLEELKKGGSLTDAFQAAVKRAEELSR